MKSPVYLAIVISISTSMGFILGSYFENIHRDEIIKRTISAYSSSRNFINAFSAMSKQANCLNSIASITDANDLTNAKEKATANLEESIAEVEIELSKLNKKNPVTAIFEKQVKEIKNEHGL